MTVSIEEIQNVLEEVDKVIAEVTTPKNTAMMPSYGKVVSQTLFKKFMSDSIELEMVGGDVLIYDKKRIVYH